VGISGLPLRNLGQNDIWVLVPWLDIKYAIRGEGGGFPQVRSVVSLVSQSFPVVHPSTKSAPTMH
jgi:hypothetical protein